MAEARVPTAFGEFTAVSYSSIVDVQEHVAFVKGDIKADESILVRVHSECLTGDVFGSNRCDCGDQSKDSLKKIKQKEADERKINEKTKDSKSAPKTKKEKDVKK